MVWRWNSFVGQFFFSKGGNWAWYSVDVDGENIIQDCILGVGLTWVVLWVDCVLQLSKAGLCFRIQARPLLYMGKGDWESGSSGSSGWAAWYWQARYTHHLPDLPDQEGQQFTSVFIIHRPYFQHPQTKDFWTQNQSYEWMIAPCIACLEQDFQIKTSLKNFIMELNHIPSDQPEILHTSLGTKHKMFMIPTLSLHSQPPNHGIIIKEEKPNYTDFLFKDSQDPYLDFTPVPSPSPYELGSSSFPYPPFSSHPNKPEHYPQPLPSSPPDIPLAKGQYYLWPCAPRCSHP